MNNEKVRKYQENLETDLKKLKDDRQELIEKFNNGEALSSKELKRNKQIITEIQEIQNELSIFDELDLFDKMVENLDAINSNYDSEFKCSKINELLSQFKELNGTLENELLNKFDLKHEDLNNLDKLKEDVSKELEDLKIELRLAKRRNYETSEIESDIDNTETFIESINDYKNKLFDLNKIENDLKQIANDVIEKDAIIDAYKTIIVNEKNKCISNIENNINIDFDEEEIVSEEIIENYNKNELKAKTKEKSIVLSEILTNNGKKIVKIIGTVAICVSVALLVKSCVKDNKNSKSNSSKTEIEQLYDNVDKKLVNSLIAKGYNEYAAILMANNFDDKTLNALQTLPYIKEVENYSTEKEFNLDYLNDYENARVVYNLTSDKTVDYVNRSVKIQETEFYNDASINDIVEIVMAIDNKDLFKQENASSAQSFNTSFNRITDNYLFGTITDKDLTKLDALQYFAKEGTDMDLFLTEFGKLAKENIENPNNKEAKTKMYTYMAEFTLSLNGFENNDEDIDVEKSYNTNAILNDYYDWIIAYNSFVAPLYPALVDENEFEKYEKLQYIMLSALQGPEFQNICGQGRSLGGE